MKNNKMMMMMAAAAMAQQSGPLAQTRQPSSPA
jgi:hypothetical protein